MNYDGHSLNEISIEEYNNYLRLVIPGFVRLNNVKFKCFRCTTCNTYFEQNTADYIYVYGQYKSEQLSCSETIIKNIIE